MHSARLPGSSKLHARFIRCWTSWHFLLLATACGWMAALWLPDYVFVFGVIVSLYHGLLDLLSLPLILVLILFCTRQLRDLPGGLVLIARVVVSTLVLSIAVVVLALSASLLMAPAYAPDPKVLTGLGQLLLAADAPDGIVSLGNPAADPQTALFSYSQIISASTVFGALVRENLLQVMLIAASAGLALALVDSEKTLVFDGIVETSYRALTRLVQASNFLLPLIAFAAAMQMTIASTQPQVALLLYFLLSFLAVAAVLVATAVIYLSVKTQRPLSLVLLTLKDSVAVTLFGGSSIASVSLAIEAMSEHLGVRRLSTALAFPFAVLLVRPGTALFVAMLAVFVAQVYGLSLSTSDVLAVVLISLLMAFLSTDLHSRMPAWNFGLLMLYLGLPLDFTVMLSITLEPYVHALRNLINVMAACVIAAWVCDVQADRPPQAESTHGAAWMLCLSSRQVLVLSSGVLLCGGLIVLLGVGFGARL